MAHFTGIDAVIAEVRKAAAELERQAVEETKRAARIIQESLFEQTPVWSGETVRNFGWNVGAPPARGTKPAIGSGEPGPTNHLPLGAEPRRPENEAAVWSELNSLLTFNKLADLYVTNTVAATKWNMIDAGVAPAPGKARNPGGVEAPAMQAARGRMPLWR